MDMQIINGGADHAPIVPTRAFGAHYWSGKAAADLSPAETDLLEEFCHAEGWRRGDQDGRAGTVDPSFGNPFHPAFLGGLLHLLWRENYRRGMRHAKAVLEGAAPLQTYALAA